MTENSRTLQPIQYDNNCLIELTKSSNKNLYLVTYRLSLANALYENPSLPRRKLLLSTGGQNYRPPLERSKSAPKLSAIEEDIVAEEIEQQRILEELRTLENVAHSWQDQDSWRLARLLDALNRESSDENGSISSGCETASTATSEERAPGAEDHATGYYFASIQYLYDERFASVSYFL